MRVCPLPRYRDCCQSLFFLFGQKLSRTKIILLPEWVVQEDGEMIRADFEHEVHAVIVKYSHQADELFNGILAFQHKPLWHISLKSWGKIGCLHCNWPEDMSIKLG